jgi:phosphate:Na+ symporter
MSVGNIISLLGGLGAFLFGMKYMGEGLEQAAGSKMKDLLEKLTRNRIMGFLLGMLVTVCIQSSSATTVMVMGFINAGIMDLAQATGVIFGANIGTTITSVLIALDASGIAPFCIFVGAFLMLYAKKKTYRHVGQCILGFGLLFQGLHTMSSAMSPLKDVIWFQNFIMNAKSPILGLLVGIAICAVIQSSSAAIGILQALAMQGMMPLYFASFLICGINIGSATPTILSAFNARNNAKRAAIIYLIYNVVSALIMVPVTLILPYTQWIERLIPVATFQVSVCHIIFKIVAAVVLLPLTNQVVKLTYKIVPKQKHEDALRLEFIDTNLGVSTSSLLQIRSEVERMMKLVKENLELAKKTMMSKDMKYSKRIHDNEEVIDFLTGAISDYLVHINVNELSDRDSKYITHVYRALNDLERIGDYALIIAGLTEKCIDQNVVYTDAARGELEEIYQKAMTLYEEAAASFLHQYMTMEHLAELTKLQREISKMANQSQVNHMSRMRDGECSAESGLVFVEVLNSLSRVGGHSINIAEASVAD